MSDRDQVATSKPKVKLHSLNQLKKSGKPRPHDTVMRRHLVQSRKRWRPKGGWRSS